MRGAVSVNVGQGSGVGRWLMQQYLTQQPAHRIGFDAVIENEPEVGPGGHVAVLEFWAVGRLRSRRRCCRSRIGSASPPPAVPTLNFLGMANQYIVPLSCSRPQGSWRLCAICSIRLGTATMPLSLTEAYADVGGLSGRAQGLSGSKVLPFSVNG